MPIEAPVDVTTMVVWTPAEIQEERDRRLEGDWRDSNP